MSGFSQIRSLQQLPPGGPGGGLPGATDAAAAGDNPAEEIPAVENPAVPGTTGTTEAAPVDPAPNPTATPTAAVSPPAGDAPTAATTASPPDTGGPTTPATTTASEAASSPTAAAHPCEWFENGMRGGCRPSAEYFLNVGGFKCLEETALPEYIECRAAQSTDGCSEDAPDFCETKALVTGPDVCVRAESIVSRDTIQMVNGVTSINISENCTQIATLEDTAEKQCMNQYTALYDVTGCCSCDHDQAVFLGEVTASCAIHNKQTGCESEASRQNVDALLCNIMQPADALGCANSDTGDGSISKVAVGGIVAAVILCVVAAAILVHRFRVCRRRRPDSSEGLEGLHSDNTTNSSGNVHHPLKSPHLSSPRQSVFAAQSSSPSLPRGHFSAPIFSKGQVSGSGPRSDSVTSGKGNGLAAGGGESFSSERGGTLCCSSANGNFIVQPPLGELYQSLVMSSRQVSDDVQFGHPMTRPGSFGSFQNSFQPQGSMHGPTSYEMGSVRGSMHGPTSYEMGSVRGSVNEFTGSMAPSGAAGLQQDGSFSSMGNTMHGSAMTAGSYGNSPARWGGIPAEFIKVTRMPEMPGGFTVCTNDTFAHTRVDATAVASSINSDASKAELLEAQLDYLQARGDGAIFNFLKLAPFLGRRMGGQGAVAFAHHRDCAANLYAIKFFFSSSGFQVEKEAACNETLRVLMPPVATIEDDSCTLAAATAHMPPPLNETPLPPAIVTEKGESLDEFVGRSAPDRFTALQVMVHIARKLEQLHAAGFVHRDLKPGNAIWLPSQNSWTLIDFGSSARAGGKADLNFSLYYAPPEVVIAFKDGKRDMAVSPSIDVWSLGVICWELLTKHKFYGSGTVRTDKVVAMLRGKEKLPTEEPLPADLSQTLGSSALRESILSMLHRDPQQRPSIESLLATWTQMF